MLSHYQALHCISHVFRHLLDAGNTFSFPLAGKHFTRKDSADSGISGTSSRKTSTTSSTSAGSILEEPSEDTIKEETPFTEPDEDLCEKITQQVRKSSITF